MKLNNETITVNTDFSKIEALIAGMSPENLENWRKDVYEYIDSAPDQLTRNARKAILFGILYGMKGK